MFNLGYISDYEYITRIELSDVYFNRWFDVCVLETVKCTVISSDLVLVFVHFIVYMSLKSYNDASYFNVPKTYKSVLLELFMLFSFPRKRKCVYLYMNCFLCRV